MQKNCTRKRGYLLAGWAKNPPTTEPWEGNRALERYTFHSKHIHFISFEHTCVPQDAHTKQHTWQVGMSAHTYICTHVRMYLSFETIDSYGLCSNLFQGSKWGQVGCVGMGCGWSSRQWRGGHCPGSCSGGFSDRNGFHTSPQPQPFGSSLDCGVFPVDAVVGLLNVNCDAILGVSSFHHLSMFNQSDFQCPPSFSRVYTPLGNPYSGCHTPHYVH